MFENEIGPGIFQYSVRQTPGGGHFHIYLYIRAFFPGYHFSAQIPEQGVKIDQKFLNRL